MSVRLRFALLASSSLLLLFFQLASAQTDPAACSVSCRFVIVPTLGPQGLPGLNGTRGETGDTGQRGPEGLQGPQGPPGINGKDGINGTNGIDGIDGKDGINGTDGATGTFDLSSTHTGLKLEAPVLTGAINIDGAVLTGSTNIGEGATILQPNIDGAALTGSTSIGEGATILSPNITAPIIDGATIIGEGSIIVRPNISAPIIDSAEVQNSKITQSTVNGTVITASETNGHFRMTKWASLGIGGSISESTGANPGYAMINATMTGNVLTTDKATFFTSHTGCVIEWADGVNAVIQSIGPQQGEIGAINVTTTMPLVISRGWQMVKLWLGNSMLSSSFAVFQDKVALKGVIGGKTSAVTIDVTKMRVDAGVRHQTSWTFPHPGPAGQQNYFVGEESVQTLKNKVLDSARLTGITRVDRLSGGLGLTNAAVTSTYGPPSLGFASTTIAGLVKIRLDAEATPVGGAIIWTLTLPAVVALQHGWMTITPANAQAAALYGPNQVWIDTFAGGGAPPQNVFTCKMGSTPLIAGEIYAWVYQVLSSN